MRATVSLHNAICILVITSCVQWQPLCKLVISTYFSSLVILVQRVGTYVSPFGASVTKINLLIISNQCSIALFTVVANDS